jgi:peptide-methionine (S)-S-oxide reductase
MGAVPITPSFPSSREFVREKIVDKATFAAGCFWGIEAAYRRVEGVTGTAAGYTGGSVENPTYEDVCSGTTGHAESVQVEFDPEVVSYGELLDLFWEIHDPTSRNRQGPDIGSQYRSAVFYHTPEQEQAVRAAIERLDADDRFKNPIVTEVAAASAFYKAEEYHQCYFEKHDRD